MNSVILMGRLTKDPDVRHTGSEKVYARMTLAVDRRRAKDGQQQTDFPTLIAWGKTAEFAEQYLSKGQRVLIEGRIQTNSYEKDGEKRYTTDVNVERIEFADGKKKEQEEEIPMDDYRDENIPL